MLNPWVRVLMWAVVALFVLLFFSIMHEASASTLKIEGDVVTMSKQDFIKLTVHMRGIEETLNRASQNAILYQELYEKARDCVKSSAASGLPVTPCFNQDNEMRDMTGEYTYPNAVIE